MNYCEICKYRHTWDCQDEIETGRTECKDFKIDLSSDKVETGILRLIVMFEKEKTNGNR